jgi:hypothetical protein
VCVCVCVCLCTEREGPCTTYIHSFDNGNFRREKKRMEKHAGGGKHMYGAIWRFI